MLNILNEVLLAAKNMFELITVPKQKGKAKMIHPSFNNIH